MSSELDGFPVQESGARWILASDLGRWFDGIDLAAADVGPIAAGAR